jgi:hypothetical protein
VVGGFALSEYWSSTEFDEQYVWIQNFSGYQTGFNKYLMLYVRAIRAF